MAGPFQESDGSVSMRRILAMLFFVASLLCYLMAFRYSASGWWIFIPGLSFELGALLLLFFTTWGDIAAIAAAWKGK